MLGDGVEELSVLHSVIREGLLLLLLSCVSQKAYAMQISSAVHGDVQLQARKSRSSK